jgi:hypothetical protein
VDYQTWLPLLGLAATDKKVVSMLAALGVTAPVTMPPDMLTTGVDFKPHGFGVGFVSEFKFRGGIADLPILVSVVIIVAQAKKSKGWSLCKGALPGGLKQTDSKNEAISKLGPPDSCDDDFCSAGWTVDGLKLAVRFDDDWKQIKQLGLSLPGAL